MYHRMILPAMCLIAWWPCLCAGQIEVTPFYGYQFGGGFEDADTGQDYDLADGPCAGAQLNLNLNEISQVEFYFSRQQTELESEGPFPTDTLFDLDIDYYHFGGTLLIIDGKWQPFVVGTLGRDAPGPGAVLDRLADAFSRSASGAASATSPPRTWACIWPGADCSPSSTVIQPSSSTRAKPR